MNLLWQRVKHEVKQAGSLSFARLMELALYSEHGYYTSKVRIGKSGADFFTASQIPLFSLTLASAIVKQITSWKNPPMVQILEIGAGQGELAQGIARRLQEMVPAIQFRYCILEESAYLREIQQIRLQPLQVPNRFSFDWSAPDKRISTIIIGNEVLDALPVERIRKTQSGWEMTMARLCSNQDGLEWFWEPASEEVCQLAERYVDCPVKTLAEVCPSCESFMTSVLTGFTAPVLALWIDYGITREEWQAGIRPQGTLRAYAQHQLVDPLNQLLRADLTADVNWTQAAASAAEAGMTEVELVSQGQYLMDQKIIELAMEKQQGEKDMLAGNRWIQQFRQLAFPGGMGDRFSVLVCRRTL